MKKIVFGSALMISGVCGVSAIGIIAELNAFMSGRSFFDKVSSQFLRLPFLFFLIIAIVGFRMATKEYMSLSELEDAGGKRTKTLSEEIQEHANERKES